MSTPTPASRRQTVAQAGLMAEPPLKGRMDIVSGQNELTQTLPTVKPAKPSTFVNRIGQVIGVGLVLILSAFLLGALGIIAVKLLMGLWGWL